MTTERIITTEPTLDLANISTYTTENGTVLPSVDAGVSISCSVKAEGLDDEGGSQEIIRETASVLVTEPSTVEPRFIDSSFSITLDTGGMGFATVDTIEGYDSIEWTVTNNMPSDPPSDDDPFPEVGAGEVTDWRPMSEFRSLMPTAENQTITIPAGVGYYMSVAPPEDPEGDPEESDNDPIQPPAGTIIEGGHFSSAMPLTWTPVPGEDGLFSANIPAGMPDPFTTIGSGLKPLVDQYAVGEIPQQACWPINTNPDAWEWDIAVNYDFWIDVRSGGPTNNPIGDILTTRGDNEDAGDPRYSGDPDKPIITGFRFYEGTTVRQQLTDLLDGVDETKLIIVLQADANVVGDFTITSWDPSTGELMINTTYKAPGYARFVLTGMKEFIADRANRYAIDYYDDKIYYRPRKPDQFEGMIAVTDTIFDSIEPYTLKDLTMSGSFESNTSSAQIRGSVTVTGSYFHSGSILYRTKVGQAPCVWENNLIFGYNKRALAGFPGGSVARGNKFINVPRQSAILAQAPDDGLWDPVIVEDNYFSMKYSNHGQGLSLYGDSWQNAIVRHNIFHDCQRASSFQPSSSGPKNSDQRGVFRFENNLIILDDFYVKGAGIGQSSLSFNGAPDDHLEPFAGEQRVIFRNNTVVPNYDQFDSVPITDADPNKWALAEVQKFRYSKFVAANNIFGTMGANEGSVGFLPHKRVNNIFLNSIPAPAASYGAADLLTPSDWKDAFDYSRYAATGPALTGASDGGKLGIRWANWGDEVIDLRTLPVNWATQYPAEALPEIDYDSFGDSFNVLSDEDRRPQGIPVLVQQALVTSVDGTNANNTQTTILEDEEVFQWDLGRGEFNLDEKSGAVKIIYFWQGSKALDFGATQFGSEYSLDDADARNAYRAAYEVRFRYTDEFGNSTPILTLAPRVEGQSLAGAGGQPRYVSLTPSQSSSVGTDIPFWRTGCSIEYFVYRLDPFGG